MKVIQLRLKNLGPFYVTPVELDFENGPLADASLVAITGRTGAGKTMLFDAICVALYGKTPRLDGIEDKHPRHLLSHDRTEGHAEVIFEANRTRYLAKWSIERGDSPSGKLKVVTTDELITDRLHPLGKSTGSSERMISEEIESILGLDFDAFKRSVMLAQGEFAAFLKAAPADKLKILTAAADLGIYDDLRGALKEKMNAVRADLRTALTEPTTILGFVDLTELAPAKSVLRELDNILLRNGDPGKTGKGFVSKDLDAILGVLRKQVSDAKETLCRLKKDASALADLAEEHECKKRREEERTEAFKKLECSKKCLCELLARAPEIAALEKELERAILANQLHHEKSAYDNAKSEQDEAESELRDGKKKRDEAQKDSDLRRAIFDEIDDAYQTALSEAQTKKAAYNAAIPDLRSAHNLFARADALIPEEKKLEEKIASLSSQLTDGRKRRTKLVGQIRKAETFIDENPLPADRQERLKLRDLAVLANPIKALRQKLNSGEPCLVCGATEHPHAHEIASEIGSATEPLLWNAIPDYLHGLGPTLEEALSRVVKRIDAVEAREEECRQKQSQLRELDLTIQATQRELENAEDTRKSVLADIEGYQRDGNELLAAASEKTGGLTTEAEIDAALKNLEDAVREKATQRDEAKKALTDSETLLTQAQTDYNLRVSLRDKWAAKLETARKTYLDKLSGTGFDSPEAHDNAFREEEWIEAAKLKIANYRQEMHQLEVAIAELSARFEETPFDPKKLGQIIAKLAKIEEDIRKVDQRIGAQRQIVTNLKDALSKFNDSAEKVREAYEEFSRWNNLRMTIAHPNPGALSNFALQVVLEQVSQFANTQLEYLTSGRYQLKVEVIRKLSGLKLTVVDKWNANKERPVETLSGGESFLTSFALALGLSEVSRGRAQIDSLFLDEGFGTLDAETLDIIIDSLDRLRKQGRSIFLISHVEKLTRRLPVEIRVRKGRNGNSTVDVG